MSKIDSPAAAIGHLYDFRDDKVAQKAELRKLQQAGQLALSQDQFEEVCAFWKLGAFDPSADPSIEASPAGGASAAMRTASEFGSSIGMSDFARKRNRAGTGHSYFRGSEAELLKLVKKHWEEREPGVGRTDLEKVVVVPVPAQDFVCGTVKIKPNTKLSAELYRRQPEEDAYVRVTAEGQPEPAHFAKLVLYSKEALLENDGVRSGNTDWEVVAIIASPVEHEPMDPLTMARNMLGKPGGTPVEYSAQQLAESIYYWSQRAKSAPTEK